jgi:hypothetical protein
MSGRSGRLLILLIAAGFFWGVLYLFGLMFAGGDVYPEYSSLRSDPQGARLLFESLARLPGVSVTRNYFPLEFNEDAGKTIVLLGYSPDALADHADMLRKTAERGNRVVAAMDWREDIKPAGFETAWKVPIALDTAPHKVHRLYFPDAKGWKVLDRVGPKILAMENGFGKGTVVLLSESTIFTNETTVISDRLDAVTAVLGPSSRIVFDEQHFGIEESGSIVSLARRFRLTGLALGLGICAALFLWRNASAFPPPAPPRFERLSGRTSQAGLLTLLRRHVPPTDLAAACWQEWLSANRRGAASDRIGRAMEVIQKEAARPLVAIREAQAILAGQVPSESPAPSPDSKGAL